MEQSAVTVQVVSSAPGTINQVVQPTVTMANVNEIEINGMPGIATGVQQVVGTAMPTISQLWYNCGPDGVPQLVTANPQQSAVVEINSADLARQFNQQLQTPYGNIQVQVQPVAGLEGTIIKSELNNPPIVVEAAGTSVPISNPKPAPKSRVRQSGNERVPCPTCGKTVSCNATLRDHMRTHTGDRPFVCGECGFAFAQRSNLRMHKRLHTGERPYMCGICGKTFARSSHLPAHMRTHTGEKPYECKECGHAFITAQQLKNHFRVHTGEKPWKCDICPAAFTHSSSLSTHKKKHTGMKPFKCEKCQKCFFFTSALDKHMKVHSKVRPFKCNECEKSFKYKESLTVHREKYCGKESASKKPRAPRRADARKPGPKPGSGRKYVQKRRGRPRGRPRKRGRYSQRSKPRRNYRDMENMVDPDEKNEETMEEDEEEKEFDDDGEEESGSENEQYDALSSREEIIPTAELKVEVIAPDDEVPAGAMILHHHSQSNGASSPSTSSKFEYERVVEHPEQITGDLVEHSQRITGDLIQMQPNDLSLDQTSLTIVSAEEAEQVAAGSEMQLVTLAPGMPLQFVQQDGENGQITHQLISTRDGIQMWYPRQNQ